MNFLPTVLFCAHAKLTYAWICSDSIRQEPIANPWFKASSQMFQLERRSPMVCMVDCDAQFLRHNGTSWPLSNNSFYVLKTLVTHETFVTALLQSFFFLYFTILSLYLYPPPKICEFKSEKLQTCNCILPLHTGKPSPYYICKINNYITDSGTFKT